MPRLASLLASLFASFLLLSATAATAQPSSAYYAAKPVAAKAATRLIIRDTMWTCASETGCISTTKASSRAEFVCESLVRKVGAISEFRVGTLVFDADALAKCNAKA